MAMEYSKCTQYSGSLNLSSEDLNKVFGVHYEVQKKKYPETLCTALSKRLVCSFNSKGCYDGVNSATFRICCISNPNKKYVLKYIKCTDDKGNRSSKFDIYTNDEPPCEAHDTHPEGRNVSGDERRELKQSLKEKLPLQV